MFAVNPQTFFYSKGSKGFTSFLLDCLLYANFINKNANITKGIHIKTIVILNGLLFTFISSLLFVDVIFH